MKLEQASFTWTADDENFQTYIAAFNGNPAELVTIIQPMPGSKSVDPLKRERRKLVRKSSLYGDYQAVVRIPEVEVDTSTDISEFSLYLSASTPSYPNTLSAEIQVEDVDDAQPFVDATDIETRNWVSTGVVFSVTDQNGGHRAFDVTDSVMSIIQREGWMKGNAMAFRFIPTAEMVGGNEWTAIRISQDAKHDYNRLQLKVLYYPPAPPDVAITGLPPTISAGSLLLPTYEVIAYDIRSATPIQWLPQVSMIQMKRSARDVGQWRLAVTADGVDHRLLSSGVMFMIRRRGRTEMLGPVTRPFDYDDAANSLIFEGADLKDLIGRRVVETTEPDLVDQVSGEDALRHYVDTYCVEFWNEYFGHAGARMRLQGPNYQRGGEVTWTADPLSRVIDSTIPIARLSELWYDVVFDDRQQIYRFEVYEQVDAGRGTLFPWVFSTVLGNVTNVHWSRKETATVMYGVGPEHEETGVRTIEKATRSSLEDVVEGIPLEKFIDLRFAGGSSLPNQTVAYLKEEAENADRIVVELNEKSVAAYRDGWDLGYVVGIEAHRIGQYAERLVEEVHILARDSQAEQISVVFGDPTRDTVDVIDNYARRMAAVQVS